MNNFALKCKMPNGGNRMAFLTNPMKEHQMAKKILTRERLDELLLIDPETGIFTWKANKGGLGKKATKAGFLNKDGYIKIGIDTNEYMAHRLMWLYVHGKFPDFIIDHIDKNKTNNAIVNLRLATAKQNSENMRRPNQNTSGYHGVHLKKALVGRKKPWQANITHNGKTIHIGYFESAEEALSARQLAENTYFTHHPK